MKLRVCRRENSGYALVEWGGSLILMIDGGG